MFAFSSPAYSVDACTAVKGLSTSSVDKLYYNRRKAKEFLKSGACGDTECAIMHVPVACW